jgi:hypothetical protein
MLWSLGYSKTKTSFSFIHFRVNSSLIMMWTRQDFQGIDFFTSLEVPQSDLAGRAGYEMILVIVQIRNKMVILQAALRVVI